ncbi:carboxypeptidase M32 [Psychromonas sp. 14N.309.X.WAT.B.A12]|uniref:carboxypeptidase M32 n=2 Tax=unclassified Psychromonas TaxID=2614957 RepID=UPI0025B00181|nr:carboxypeptidase M32 [Psychromonas sp. 14N.309.X.WAT.B.A12]MDN2662284.1 carboxypeptidase M32 [Psychromonas sp. 14N.309.X.WAT.B.A12]
MSNYDQLTAHYQTINHFNHAQSMLGWDAAANMPAGGNDARSQAMAELSVHVHRLSTQPQLGEWFDKAQQESLSSEQQSSLREMKRQWQQATIVPEALVQAQSIAGSKCEHAWRSQRPVNDWEGFEKNWKEVVKLSREEAKIRSEALGLTPYDAMLDKYEPGTTTASLDILFSDVKTWLPELIEKALEKQRTQSIIMPSGTFSTSSQKALGIETMKLLKFDFDHGRLDQSVHPFCGGVPSDVRITTRYDERDFVQALMGIVHETGHARYEQGLPKAFAGLPVGEARSMGVHESQSLFFEMQIGRSKPFISHLSKLSADAFRAHQDPVFAEENLYKIYTKIEKGFIRVDADELTYPAHVIMRYEIERDLINGVIEHSDVPGLWDEKMQASLGLSTKGNYQNGCMQDIHWTDGAFGYFPSYTLGAMYAAQYKATMQETVDIDGAIKSGDLSPIFKWLSDNIWSQGSLHTTDELIKRATGETLNTAHFKKHLETRYL